MVAEYILRDWKLLKLTRRWRRGNMGEEMLWGVKNGDLPTVKKCVENQVRESLSYYSCLFAREIKGELKD